jgi:hypothetical protein
MQFSHTQTQITVHGTPEEVARFLVIHPLPRSNAAIDLQTVPAATPPPEVGPVWQEFRKTRAGKMKEFLEFLIENKGKVSVEKLKNALSMSQLQANAYHGMLNGKALKLTGEKDFITTDKNGRALYYFIRPAVFSHLL